MTDESDRMEQIARSLANIEAMYGEMLRKQDEDRAEAKERQARFDEEAKRFTDQSGFREHMQAFDSREWMKQLGHLLFAAAMLVLAIAAANRL